MNHYKLLIRYNGQRYFGWQVQADTPMTVQGQIHKALEKIAKSKTFKTVASGRTDTGVHALGQVVKVSMELKLNPESLVKGLNSFLPQDIQVLEAFESNEAFHPVFKAESKEYQYYFKDETRALGPFLSPYVAHINAKLELSKVNEALKLLEGEHDFCNFFCTGTPTKSTVRTIHKACLEEHLIDGPWGKVRVYRFCFVGSGFLKQMVRLLVGALWQVGQGRASIEDLKSYLGGQKFSQKLGPTAPAQGLYLVKVHYPS